MSAIIIILIVTWLVVSVVGALIEGLFWLTVVGLVLLVATGIYGWVKGKAAKAS